MHSAIGNALPMVRLNDEFTFEQTPARIRASSTTTTGEYTTRWVTIGAGITCLMSTSDT